MKRIGIVFTVLAAILIALTARAQDEYTYSKLFEEGKVWNVVDEWYDCFNEKTFNVDRRISVNGEWTYDCNHLITNVDCTDSGTDETVTRSYLEENSVIYNKKPDSFRCLIDFNLVKGDRVAVEQDDEGCEGIVLNYCYVVNDETIDIRGTKRRILSIGSERDGVPFTYWIEGIGAVDDWNMSVCMLAPTNGIILKNRRISSCYLNGECIFTYQDLEDYMTKNGVKSTGLSEAEEGRLSYDGGVLKVSGYSGNVTVDVSSLDGTLLISEKMNGGSAVSTSSLPEGCYIALASFPDGSKASLKFIKK